MDWHGVGKSIKDARIRKGMTQKDLAEKLGVTPVSISYYEAGKKRPPFDKIKIICQELNLKMEEL